MIHNSIDLQTQAQIRVLDKIDDFFRRFKISPTLHRCGIRKRHGHSVHSLMRYLFLAYQLRMETDDRLLKRAEDYRIVKEQLSNCENLTPKVEI